jgi:Rrf2 family protein
MADLIRMSEATALGLHTMAVVARRDGPTPAARIAEELHASEAHLSKVLQQLVRAGFLRSKRGPTGGYALAKPAEEISLLDVYEALEGRLRNDGCLFSEPVCRQVSCILSDLVERLRSEAHGYLQSTSLRDVANGKGR